MSEIKNEDMEFEEDVLSKFPSTIQCRYKLLDNSQGLPTSELRQGKDDIAKATRQYERQLMKIALQQKGYNIGKFVQAQDSIQDAKVKVLESFILSNIESTVPNQTKIIQ